MKHVVEITEYFTRHVIVEADDWVEANKKVCEAYTNGEIELDYDDFSDSSIDYIGLASEREQKFYEEI